jgi:hypothetical protein
MDDAETGSESQAPSSHPDVIHFPKWAALAAAPASQDDALVAFNNMAQKDSGPFAERPSRAALNPKTPRAMPIRVYINLAEPDGDQDHCLFKDAEGRKHKGQRRPEDYLPDRAARIEFIPEVLIRPEWVFEEKSKPSDWIYACQTGANEFYLVVVEVRKTKRRVECDLKTAYPVDSKG